MSARVRGSCTPGHRRLRRLFAFALLIGVAMLALPPASGPVAGGRSEASNALIVSPSTGEPFVHWSTFHGEENHSGYSPFDGPSVGTPLWDLAPPQNNETAIRSGVVANDSAIFFDDALGRLWAFNRTPGAGSPGLYPAPTVLWSRLVGSTLTTPDLSAGDVFVGTSQGWIVVVNASTGALQWERQLDGGIPQGVAVGGGEVIAGTDAGTVWALNSTTGTVLWQTPLGAPVAGAVALEGATLVAATTVGGIVAISLNGAVLWRATVGQPIGSGPAIFGSAVLVGDLSGNVSRLSLTNGSTTWRFVGSPLASGPIQATPAVDPGRVYVSSYYGQVMALSLANGTLAWNASTPSAGFAALSSPAIAPNGLYVSDADQFLDDLDPATGRTIWSETLGYFAGYGPPAVDGGVVMEGTDGGVVLAFGPPGGPPAFPVSGTVTTASGTPIASARVAVGGRSTSTDVNGSFTLSLANGSYAVTVTATDFVPLVTTLSVDGGVSGIHFVLTPVPLAPVSGRVLDGQTLRALGGVSILFFGPYGSESNTTSAPDGSFSLLAPVGYDFVTASPPAGFVGAATHVEVPAAGLAHVEILLPEVAVGIDGRLFLLPLAAIGGALLVVGIGAAQARRRELGWPTGLVSPFATYVGARVVLLFFQAAAILSVLYVFGTILPAAALHSGPCGFIDKGCEPGGWKNPVNVVLAYGYGTWHFVLQLVQGEWGMTTYGKLTEPATTFFLWFGPNSIELALFALPLSALIAYGVGLWAGAHPGSGFDVASRLAAIGGLLVPTFLIVLLLAGALYAPFLGAVGDSPYGFLPTPSWFFLHGGYPGWIGPAGNTTPTGFPLVDTAAHGDWPLFGIVLLKTLWQALAIALVYVSIYLRFVRHAVADAYREPNIVAARARGISEPTLLWHHTGRRVLPMLVLVFGLTLPLYLGTQALVEVLAQDNGIGTLLIVQMTHAQSSGFGFQGATGTAPGAIYQLVVFLFVVLVLVGELFADVLARYLDPRLLRSAR
jgi:outer membrane protein assembly factor BamB